MTGITLETRIYEVTYKISSFVSKFDFEVSGDEISPWHFVIEIYQFEQTFYPRVFRWESYMIIPTETDLKICEEKILVKDEFTDWDSISHRSEACVKNSVIEIIKKRFEF